jgi:DNA polymerase
MTDDLRSELIDIVRMVRAHVEWQVDAGAVGLPKGSYVRPKAPLAAPAEPAPTEASATPPPALPQPAFPEPTFEPERGIKKGATAKVAAVAPVDRGPLRELPVVQQEVAACTKCQLHETRTQTVFARGNPAARICFVGEAPGADEDAQGLPFVGRAGQLLDRMITAMGLDPERDVYVCNIVKCRPPDNRKPTDEEMATCIPFLHEQLRTVTPEVIVTLGNTAAQGLLGTKLGITKLRGQWKLYKGSIQVMPTYHPSYLLRPSPQQAEAKKQAWEDLQQVMKELGLTAPTKKR